ncbi:hypothetical protein ACHWQZ_G014239 [Mnemiopsis leidyi]
MFLLVLLTCSLSSRLTATYQNGESQDLRERIKGEIIPISAEQSRTKYSTTGAEKAIDGDLSTWSYAYPENSTGRAWLKIRLAKVSSISQVIVRMHGNHASPDLVWNCSEQECLCVSYYGWCPYYKMSVSTETKDGYSISGANPRQCTRGNLVNFEVVKKIWGTEVEMYFWATEIIIIGNRRTGTQNWRYFYETNPLNLTVDMGEEENYLVRFPCRNYIWVKLFLYGDGDSNSHVELFQNNMENGNIYCNKAGDQSWYEGEKTKFGINKSWECEDDGENMILEIKKTTQYVKLKNRGNELYTKEFNSSDGNCYKQTKRITTQVWNYGGFLSLYLLSEKGQHCSTLNSTLDDYKMITKPLLPVNDGTNLTLSCSADYVNLENTTSTAECRNGTVVATSKLPKCVKAQCKEEDTSWWNDVIMANLTLPLLNGQKVEISGCRARRHTMASEYGYKPNEYEDVMKKLNDALKPVLKCRKSDGKISSAELKDKLGDKMNMATVIVALTNACLNAESMIKKMHGHNFELRGKVADLSTAAIKKLAAEMDRNKSEIMKEIGDTVKENVDLDKSTQRSFADILGTNKEALVLPMKQAIKEIEKEDDRKKNVVITGLDLNPAVTDRKQQEEQVKTLATETVNEALRGGPGEVKELVVMGKMSGNSGKAPPVLVTLTNSEEARNVIKGASRLSRVQGLRNVYISPDLNKEERTRRKVLAEDLKKKIADFPEQYWYIRHGTVSSKGKYVPRNQSNSKIMDDDKEMDKSFNY